MRKVVLVTEYLNPPYDEGIKKTAYNLYLELNKKYELQVICRYGFEGNNIKILKSNSLFLSSEIKQLIDNFNPDRLIYLPFQSSTFASYLRLKIFSFFAKQTRVILIALQPKPLKKWQQFIVRFITPEFALTPSPALYHFWKSLNINCQLIPLLTDLEVFKPIRTPNLKQSLRKKYNLPVDEYIVSHMGHLNKGRNLKILIPLQKKGIQIIIVGSSSTPNDAIGKGELRDELLESGIIIIDKYIKNIEEIYQLSDLYIFPVEKENSSIGMPLSILEARACGIPVITTNYGSIKAFLGNDYEGIIYCDSNCFLSCLLKFKKDSNIDYKKTKINKLNKNYFSEIQKMIEQ